MFIRIKYMLSKFLKKTLNIPAIKDSKLDKTSRVCSGAHVVNSCMGRYSYIGNYSTVIYTSIGAFSSIGDNCVIGGGSHPINWVSTSPVFHSGRNILKKNFSKNIYNPYKVTKIGNDVWIGTNCLIKAGIKIGDGAVIGMGSIVTKDVESYTIVGGNPAKAIRKRFSEEIIRALLEIEWWNKRDDDIFYISQEMNNIDKFLELCNIQRGVLKDE